MSVIHKEFDQRNHIFKKHISKLLQQIVNYCSVNSKKQFSFTLLVFDIHLTNRNQVFSISLQVPNKINIMNSLIKKLTNV